MAFTLKWTAHAASAHKSLKDQAQAAAKGRAAQGEAKSSKAEGLYNQFQKALRMLRDDPKHKYLNSHQFYSLSHPYKKDGKVWESYVQNQAPGAYRVFWCYGPESSEITILAITPHP
jgi:hypothetical protein